MFVERFRDAGVKAAREACYGGGHASGDSATVMLVLHMESGFDRLEVARVTVEDDGGMDERLLGCLVRSQEGIVLDMPGLTSSQRYRVTWPIVASRR